MATEAPGPSESALPPILFGRPRRLRARHAQDLRPIPAAPSASKTCRAHRLRRRQCAIRVEAVPDHGMATIWDADILIWAASQIAKPVIPGFGRPADGRHA
ncbi:replication initiator protein A [Paracoccus mutanolyticus]|uniref:replication initiator protein A n=1 Tax=Paracoccus mutanolyticus TaxID=1499308 RepID=UPI001CB9CD67